MNAGVPGQAFQGSDLGMAVQVLENGHERETKHSMGAGFTLVFVKLAPLVSLPYFPLSAILFYPLKTARSPLGFGKSVKNILLAPLVLTWQRFSHLENQVFHSRFLELDTHQKSKRLTTRRDLFAQHNDLANRVKPHPKKNKILCP